MKGSYYLAILSLIMALVGVSCAPAAAPAPGLSAPAPLATPQPTPQLSPEEAAWAQVVTAAKTEGRVTLYSYSFVGDDGIALDRAFRGKYGITLDIVTGRGSEFGERLRTEARMGRMTADLNEGSSLHLTSAKAVGLTVETGSLPSLREKDVWFIHPLDFYDPEGHVLAYNFYLLSPFVNSNLVKPQDYPKVWKDLLAPRWKGQMMISDPRVSQNLYVLFVPLIARQVLGWDFVEALGKQELRLSTGSSEEGGWLARGERPLSIFGSPSSYANFMAQGAPIRALPIEDGLVAAGSAIEAIKGAPHPNAAKVFMNWLFSQEGQQAHAKARSVSSIRKDVVNHTPEPGRIQAKKIIVPTSEDAEQQAKLFREGFVTKLWLR